MDPPRLQVNWDGAQGLAVHGVHLEGQPAEIPAWATPAERHCEVGNTQDFSIVTSRRTELVTGQEALPSQKHTVCPAGLSQQNQQGLALLARGQDIPAKTSGASGLRVRLRTPASTLRPGQPGASC